MDSKYFYGEFQKGKLGDDLKFIRWAGEYETLERLQKDYNELHKKGFFASWREALGFRR
jgi:hypothetical protein